jgi:hypothetical protein
MIMVPGQPGKKQGSICKIARTKGAEGMDEVVECLCIKCKDLSSNHSITKKP